MSESRCDSGMTFDGDSGIVSDGDSGLYYQMALFLILLLMALFLFWWGFLLSLFSDNSEAFLVSTVKWLGLRLGG